jgi:hypothetical protein
MLHPLLTTTDDVIGFAANASSSIKLPRDGQIVGIDFVVTVDYSAGAEPGYANDPLFKLISGITVKGSTVRYIDINDLILLHVLNRCDYGDGLKLPNPLGASASGKAEFSFAFHFGDNVLDPFDPLSSPTKPWIVIPATEREESELTATVYWRDASAVGSGITINSARVDVAISRVQGELPASIQRYRPVYSTTREQLNTTWTGYTKRYDIPTGRFVRRIAIAAYDATGARSNNVISRVGLILPKRGQSRVIDVPWKVLQFFTLKSYIGAFGSEYDNAGNNTVGLSNGLDGVAVLDLRKITGSALGLKTVGLEVGDIQLAIDTVNPGQVTMLWDSVEAM